MNRSSVKKLLFIVLVAVCAKSHAQNNAGPTVLALSETGAYSITERSDWRRYDNGRYTGLVRNEVRASIIPKPASISNGNLLYQGNFFVLQSTLRDMRQSAQPVDAVVPVSFELYANGTIEIEDDRGFPMLRGFPTFPAQGVVPGFKWQAQGSRAVDPFNSGQPAIISFLAEYEYRGVENYRDELVHRIYAVYASRYQNTVPGANNITRIQGTHKVDILIRAEDGLAVFMRDELDETYTMTGGSTVQFRGFTLTFGEGIVLMDRKEVITTLGTIFRIEELPDPDIIILDQAAVTPINTVNIQDSSIGIIPVPEGIRLTIRDIRFVPDTAEFLPEERPRLDLIAEALKQIPDRTFLVEGHTAAIGLSDGEMELSIKRAERMVEELVRRGISADRFIYKGWGGTRPIGDNLTNEGRSLNRRVEITILE
jgi:outer membrane protein OmpA-like peptidoglycan-associated protein